ncbi:Cadherin-related hmr-1 [Toxocara canis]|uniref:Cadherin-related hmr-1 n=1 Tax=Toxocara canis TaxID=6265 RepID=A0A0B2VRJ5_TOXCA|nr:Cadherin-related hmr-1 [Toxocara canis]
MVERILVQVVQKQVARTQIIRIEVLDVDEPPAFENGPKPYLDVVPYDRPIGMHVYKNTKGASLSYEGGGSRLSQQTQDVASADGRSVSASSFQSAFHLPRSVIPFLTYLFLPYFALLTTLQLLLLF